MDPVLRLHALLSAACPVVGVSDLGPAATPRYRVDYDPSATDAQKSAAASVLASFNPDDAAAQSAWELSQSRAAAGDILPASDPIPIAVRAALLAILDDLNRIFPLVNLATKTQAEAMQAVSDKLTSGAADT